VLSHSSASTAVLFSESKRHEYADHLKHFDAEFTFEELRQRFPTLMATMPAPVETADAVAAAALPAAQDQGDAAHVPPRPRRGGDRPRDRPGDPDEHGRLVEPQQRPPVRPRQREAAARRRRQARRARGRATGGRSVDDRRQSGGNRCRCRAGLKMKSAALGSKRA
jgi:hypothetical protein